jgi:hypothetical protein
MTLYEFLKFIHIVGAITWVRSDIRRVVTTSCPKEHARSR